MGVTMCMYAGVGTQLFAFVKRGLPGGLTRQVNFGSFGNTFLILFQIMTSARSASCCLVLLCCRVIHCA